MKQEETRRNKKKQEEPEEPRTEIYECPPWNANIKYKISLLTF